MSGRGPTAIALAIALLAGWAVAASAAFTSSPSASLPTSTLTVGSVGTPTATTTDACVTVKVAWERAGFASTYQVEVQRNGGAWGVLVGDTGDVVGVTDTAATAGSTVAYRVTPRHGASGWTGPVATTATLTC